MSKRAPQSDVSRISHVRAAWVAATKASNVTGLLALVTDDIIVVLANGKCLCGKDEVKTELIHGFDLFDVEPEESSDEISIHDRWAVEFIEAETSVSPVRAGAPLRVHSKTLAVFLRQPDLSWKVSRVIELAG
jgi:ketosteroid isomerase-like protein